MASTISPPPTYADVVIVDQDTKQGKFNPIWLRWFLDLAQQTNVAVGTVTSVNVSGGTTGLTFSGGPIVSFGTITMAGTLAAANGGMVYPGAGIAVSTGAAWTTSIAVPVPIASGGTNNSSAYTTGSVVFSDGTKLTQNNTKFFWDDAHTSLAIGSARDINTSLIVDRPAYFTGANTAGTGQYWGLGSFMHNSFAGAGLTSYAFYTEGVLDASANATSIAHNTELASANDRANSGVPNPYNSNNLNSETLRLSSVVSAGTTANQIGAALTIYGVGAGYNVGINMKSGGINNYAMTLATGLKIQWFTAGGGTGTAGVYIDDANYTGNATTATTAGTVTTAAQPSITSAVNLTSVGKLTALQVDVSTTAAFKDGSSNNAFTVDSAGNINVGCSLGTGVVYVQNTAGISTTVTTGSLVGKTMTFLGGILTGFA